MSKDRVAVRSVSHANFLHARMYFTVSSYSATGSITIFVATRDGIDERHVSVSAA